MRVSRLYVPSGLSVGQRLELAPDAGRYLRDVLRLQPGDDLVVFNGQGGEFQASVEQLGRKRVTLAVQQWRARDVESPLDIRLGLGVSRGERMDFAIQKAVELGVDQLAPIVMQRSVVRLNPQRAAQRQQHWQGVARSASEQSGRTTVPDVLLPQKLETWLPDCGGLRLYPDPGAAQVLSDLTPENAQVTVITGPEGGFSSDERALMEQAGFHSVCLGPRILRAETAVLSIVSLIQALWGDLNTAFCSSTAEAGSQRSS